MKNIISALIHSLVFVKTEWQNLLKLKNFNAITAPVSFMINLVLFWAMFFDNYS